jgi:hypothetical protein
LAAGVGATIVLLAGAVCSSAASPHGSLTISPAIIDTVARPPSQLEPIAVRNTTSVVFRVRLYPAFVDQKLDGSLVIRERKSQLRAARRLFSVQPSRLVLGSGASATVRESFLRAPRGRPAAYGAAVIEATPAVRPKVGPSYRLRLLGALLVRLPTAPPPIGRIVGARVEQLGPRRLGFSARIRNTGRVHGYPDRLRLRVLDSRGRAVFVATPRPGVVLPGYQRDYPAQLFRKLRAGRYRFVASGRFGMRSSSAITRFRLVAPNRLQALSKH